MPVGIKVGSGVGLQPVWTVTVSVGIWQPLVHEVVTVLVLVVGQQSVLLQFGQSSLFFLFLAATRERGETYAQGTLTEVTLMYMGHMTSVGAGHPVSVVKKAVLVADKLKVIGEGTY